LQHYLNIYTASAYTIQLAKQNKAQRPTSSVINAEIYHNITIQILYIYYISVASNFCLSFKLTLQANFYFSISALSLSCGQERKKYEDSHKLHKIRTHKSKKMVTKRMWSAIYHFMKLFPPKIIKYNKATGTISINYYKKFWLWLYIMYCIPNWTSSIVIPVYKILHMDLSESDEVVHIIIFVMFVSIVSLCVVSMHTMILNHGYFFLLFNVISKFQRQTLGNLSVQ